MDIYHAQIGQSRMLITDQKVLDQEQDMTYILHLDIQLQHISVGKRYRDTTRTVEQHTYDRSPEAKNPLAHRKYMRIASQVQSHHSN
jgi:hypothetical protein